MLEQVVPIYSLSVAVWKTAKHWPDLALEKLYWLNSTAIPSGFGVVHVWMVAYMILFIFGNFGQSVIRFQNGQSFAKKL